MTSSIPLYNKMQNDSALPRPDWEQLLIYSTYTLMALILFYILVAAYFESETIFKYRFLSTENANVFGFNSFSPGFFQWNQTPNNNTNNNRARTTDQLFGCVSLKEKNNNVRCYNTENGSRKVQNNKKTGKRPTVMRDYSPAVCKHNRTSNDCRKTGPSSNETGVMGSHIELNEKEKEKPVKNNNEDKGRIKCNVITRTPTKCEANDKVLIRHNKSLESSTEDSSSTSTESSAGDSETVVKNENPSSGKRKNSKAKAKSADAVRKVETIENTNDDEGDFELSTKNKSHRKIKVDQSKSFGGDILKPHTLELPYNFKSPNEEKPVPVVNKPNNVTTNGKGKKAPFNKTKGSLHSLASDNSIKGRVLHTNEWDQPKTTNSSDEVFSDPGKQTETCTQKVRRPSSDRPSSYSEIVSDGLPKHPILPSKTLPVPIESTPTASPESEKKDFKHPGTIGQRPSSNKSASPAVTSSWPSMNQQPTNSLFTSDLLLDSEKRNEECVIKDTNDNDVYAFGRHGSFSFNNLWDPQTNWQALTGCDAWSNFGVKFLECDSLLNNGFDSNDWSSNDLFGYSTGNNLTGENNFYDAARLSWSVWPNSSTTENIANTATSFDPTCTTAVKESDKISDIKDTCPEFDPFRTPHDIWSPANPFVNNKENENNQTWAFSLFSNKSPSN